MPNRPDRPTDGAVKRCQNVDEVTCPRMKERVQVRAETLLPGRVATTSLDRSVHDELDIMGDGESVAGWQGCWKVENWWLFAEYFEFSGLIGLCSDVAGTRGVERLNFCISGMGE